MKLTNKKTRITILFIFAIAFSVIAQKQSVFDALPDDEVISVRLETNMKQLINKKFDEKYQPGEFEFLSGPLEGKKYDIQVKPRGNIRKEICAFPPLMLKFPKTEFEFRKVKMVQICRNTSQMEDLVLKEYLAYKLYQELTDNSFKVRLLKVLYEGERPGSKEMNRYAFFIEPKKEVADRIGGKVYEPKVTKVDVLERFHYNTMTMFQYLISNTDWAIENLHNMTLVASKELNAVITIPYDFDYSGLVNAYYAVPHKTVPIEHVTERYNKSHCMTMDEMKEIRALVLEQKDELIACVENFTSLSEDNRKKILHSFDKCFDAIENEKVCRNIFVRNCKEISN